MILKLSSFLKSTVSNVKHRLHHKAGHFKFSELKKSLVKGGIPLLVIVVGWEIIEDILFPILFGAMGWAVHPIFYTFIPVSWLLCLHWLAVPILWGLWLKISKKKD
jgi:hypothetical protein